MTTLSLSALAAYLVRRWVHWYTRGLPSVVRDARRAEIESDLWEHQLHGALTGRHPTEITAEIGVRWLMGLPADLAWRWGQRNRLAERRPVDAGEGRASMAHSVDQPSFDPKWALAVPVALAIVAVGIGIDNLRSGTDENTLRDMVGSHLGAGIAGGFVPAVLLTAGIIWAWRAPAIRVAVTLGFVFLYFAVLMAWMGFRVGSIGESLVSLAGVAGAVTFLIGLGVSRSWPRIGGPLALIGAVPMAVTLYWTMLMPVLALLLGVYGLRRGQRIAEDQRALP